MKKSKLLVLWILTFITGIVVGGTCVRFYQTSHATCKSACPAVRVSPQADLLLADLQGSSLPEGVSEVAADNTPKSSAELPSQLVHSELPADMVLGGTVALKKEEEKPAGIVLNEDQETIVLRARQPAQQASDSTSRTLIEAPVDLRRIQTREQYKAFKTQARGSYPTADFTKEEVLVLESQSNLPDNVFEIVDVVPAGENLKVRYRVNVLGLDKKINTHSAQKISKSSLPIILEQVL